jgi:predicted permease
MTAPAPDADRRWVDRCRRVIAAAACLVPADRRSDWIAEWRAEVEYRALRLARQAQLQSPSQTQSHAQASAPAPARSQTPASSPTPSHGLSPSASTSPSLSPADPHRPHVSTRAGLRLLARTAGCVAHACWLQREEWRLQMLWQDIRYGLRVLWRRPAFTVLATMTLALAIGALTAVFSVVYGVLLRPLPFHEPDRLVQVWENNPVKGWVDNVVAPANLLDWQTRAHTFDDLAAYMGSGGHDSGTGTTTMTGVGEPEVVRILQVTANIFPVLGVNAALGRTFAPDEDRRNAGVVVISDAFWRARLGARGDIIGQTIMLNGRANRIIGVMPPRFALPASDADIWTGLGMDHASMLQTRRAHFLRVIGRLKPGVTLAQGRDDLQNVARQLSTEYPDTNKTMGVDVGPLQEWIVGGVRRQLLLFLAAVGFVLLIACTNVASLLMVQSIERARELALRTALGARRGRLVRQLITECLMLSLLGSAAGVLLAVWAVQAFVAFGPSDVPRLDSVRGDATMLAFAIAAGCATTLLFGLLPALQASRFDVSSILREGGRSASASLRSQRLLRLLVAGEVALSVMLVVCAGLLIRSFVRLQQVDPGFRAVNVLTFQLSLPAVRYEEKALTPFYERLMTKLEALPGVRAAGATTQLPLTGARWTGDSAIEGRPPTDYITEVRHKTVSPRYFDTVGLRVAQGRGFAASDSAEAVTATAQSVVIINQALARKHFPQNDAIGRRISFNRPSPGEKGWHTIVGVVEDERQDGLNKAVKPEIFENYLQDPWQTLHVVLRSDSDPAALIPTVRQTVRALDPALAMDDTRTFGGLLAASVSPQRFSMLLMSAFAVAALLLAVTGVYGVVSYSVSQRRSEIGVRLALGANPRQVSRLIVRQSLTPVVIGLAAGLILAGLATRLLATQLFEVNPIDPMTFSAVSMILLAAAFFASVIPARRAMRVDPVEALRAE